MGRGRGIACGRPLPWCPNTGKNALSRSYALTAYPSPLMNRSAIFFILKLAVSLLLIGFLAIKFDFGKSAEKLLDADFAGVGLAVLVLGLLLVNNTVRWRVVMRAIHAVLDMRTTFRLLYIGIFFNQTLPSSVGGDAFRMYLGRKEGLPLTAAINGVMLERVATLTGLILLVVVTQPLLLSRIGDHPATFVFPVLAVLAVIGIALLMLLDRFPERFQKHKLIRGVAELALDTKKLFLSPARAFLAIGLGVTGNVLLALATFFLAQSIGVEVTVLDCMVLMPPVILITTVPISIAGWGLRESAMVATFAFIGIVQEDAIALSLLFGLVNAVISLPGGLLWLLSGYKRADVSDKMSEAS